MSGHHHHGPPAAGHASAKYRSRLLIAFGLVGGFFLVELVTGIISGSLALLSDAGHMAADVVALGAALTASKIAARADTTGRRSFGSYRAEVFASGLAVLLMVVAAVTIALASIQRIGNPPTIETGPMLVVGILGLVVNLISMALLRSGASESLNVRGAYLEVVADTLGSVGVIGAALLVRFTGATWWDTVIAIAIAAFVLVRAIGLGREVLSVLGQHVPAGLHTDEVEQAVGQVNGVQAVHDLHLWQLTSGMNVATLHVVLDDLTIGDRVITQVHELLHQEFGIGHTTIQIEQSTTAACQDAHWR